MEIFYRRRKSRKAQIAGEIFIYMMTAIVIGVIVLVGYWALKDVNKKKCAVEQVNFKSRMESLIERYNTYGSMNKDTLTAPCNYDILCFTDVRSMGSPLDVCKNQIINSTVRDNIKQNIFLKTAKTTIPIGYSDKITLEDPEDCLCIEKRNGNFYLTFKGKGSTTLLSPS
jgi:hypothetical protein